MPFSTLNVPGCVMHYTLKKMVLYSTKSGSLARNQGNHFWCCIAPNLVASMVLQQIFGMTEGLYSTATIYRT